MGVGVRMGGLEKASFPEFMRRWMWRTSSIVELCAVVKG